MYTMNGWMEYLLGVLFMVVSFLLIPSSLRELFRDSLRA
jgi:hypothetical protein